MGVKRLLRRYGYPPDRQMLATETVVRQAEMISQSLHRFSADFFYKTFFSYKFAA